MERYQEDLRTPPVTLVSLVGCPDLHQTISAFLHSEQPPINTLALPSFSKISIFARKKQKEGPDAVPSSTAGILKRDWISKHRTKVPAVVAVLISMDSIAGDPATWQQVCNNIDNVKVVVHGRNIKLVLVLVQSTSREDINEDLITALRKRAEIDMKYIFVFSQKDSEELRKSLNRLAGSFLELSVIYYREEARRVKNRIEKKNLSLFELNIRYCFKVAVYGEFRRDWMEALKFYEDGYHDLLEMIKVSTRLPPIQRLVEIKVVAEQFHFKVSTLLLHGGKVVEAIEWFRKHVANYEKLVGLPEVAFLHWEWMSRQFLVFAELLETISAPVPSTVPHFGDSDNLLTEWEFQPAYYYQLSASYLKEKKNCLLQCLSASGFSDVTDAMDGSLDSVVPSLFVGQSVRLLEQDSMMSMLLLNDAEYACYALAEGKKFQDIFEVKTLFKRSMESFSSLKASRMASFCSSRVAIEYFTCKEFNNAKQLFHGIAYMYRKEGWVSLLWESLGYMRECSRELGLQKDFIEISLEMASLPVFSSSDTYIPKDNFEYGPGGIPSLSQRELIQDDVFNLVENKPLLVSDDKCSTLSLAEDQIIYLEIDPVSPLRATLLASVVFHQQSAKPGSSKLITLSLLSQLPKPLQIEQLEVQFNQSDCNFVVNSSQRKLSTLETSTREQYPRIEMAQTLTLETNTWMRLTYAIKSEQCGKLECSSIIANMGQHFTICCRAESPASMEDLPLWRFENRVETFPLKDLELSFSGQKVIQIEDPEPQVDLILSSSGPALVGEIFSISVLVNSIGHEVHLGELKINIVDARGGGLMNPREIEASSFDSHDVDVELLSLSGLTEEEEYENDVDSIKKITKTFGVTPIPVVAIGETWSGKLVIKWHRPKQIMVYVSLGYCVNNTDKAQHKVNIHKSLQVEGKIPLIINHSFLLPFRCDPLLLSQIKPSESEQLVSLALNETSILIVSARNFCGVPLHLICISIELDNREVTNKCSVNRVGGGNPENALLLPGDEFKQVFSVVPHVAAATVKVGSVHIKWRRDSKLEVEEDSFIILEQKLPDVQVERPPLVVSLDCPPHAVLGEPFMVYVKVQNFTSLLQEIKFSLGDSQCFVFSGSNSNAAFILPNSEQVIPYKFIPLSCGHQQLPRINVTSIRYSAGFQSAVSASSIFIFPSEPNFMFDRVNGGTEQLSAGSSSA